MLLFNIRKELYESFVSDVTDTFDDLGNIHASPFNGSFMIQ